MLRPTLFALAMATCLMCANFALAQTESPQIVQPNGASTNAPANADSNADAWPDNPFAVLTDRELWYVTSPSRTVAALRWSGGDEEVQLIDLTLDQSGSTVNHIAIEAPGTLAHPGEIAVLLVGVAPELESLFDVSSGGAGFQPMDLLSGSPYIEISILISNDNGATFDEIDAARVAETPLSLRVDSLTTALNSPPLLHEHPSYIGADPQTGLKPVPESGDWSLKSSYSEPYADPAPGDTTQSVYLTAELRSLSVFALTPGPVVIPEEEPIVPIEELNEEETITDNESVTLENDGTTLNDGETTGLSDESETTSSDPNGGGEQMSFLLSPEVYVDFTYVGVERGTPEFPFNSMEEAVLTIQPGGVIFVANGESNETQFTVDKPLFMMSWFASDVARVGDGFVCGLNESFTFNDFDITPALSVVQDADFFDPDPETDFDTQIYLVPNANTQAGAVWTRNKVIVERGFETTFTFKLAPNPRSDGISFVIQNDSENPSLPTGGEMGYAGIVNSIAIEFDAIENEYLADPNGRHISIHATMPSLANSAHQSAALNTENILQFTGVTLDVQITYDSRAKSLVVSLNGVPRITLESFNLTQYMNLDEGRAYLGIISTNGAPLETPGPTELYSWSTTFPQSCEEIYWEEPLIYSEFSGYSGDKFDHRITGDFLQPGDVIKEEVTHISDDVGLEQTDIDAITALADGEWRTIQATRHGVSGLWRWRSLEDENLVGAEFDEHQLNTQSGAYDGVYNGDGLGTVVLLQTMKYADTNIVVARNRITFKLVKMDPAFTAEGATCFNGSPFRLHVVVEKGKASNSSMWAEATAVVPQIPCPP